MLDPQPQEQPGQAGEAAAHRGAGEAELVVGLDDSRQPETLEQGEPIAQLGRGGLVPLGAQADRSAEHIHALVPEHPAEPDDPAGPEEVMLDQLTGLLRHQTRIACIGHRPWTGPPGLAGRAEDPADGRVRWRRAEQVRRELTGDRPLAPVAMGGTQLKDRRLGRGPRRPWVRTMRAGAALERRETLSAIAGQPLEEPAPRAAEPPPDLTWRLALLEPQEREPSDRLLVHFALRPPDEA